MTDQNTAANQPIIPSEDNPDYLELMEDLRVGPDEPVGAAHAPAALVAMCGECQEAPATDGGRCQGCIDMHVQFLDDIRPIKPLMMTRAAADATIAAAAQELAAMIAKYAED